MANTFGAEVARHRDAENSTVMLKYGTVIVKEGTVMLRDGTAIV